MMCYLVFSCLSEVLRANSKYDLCCYIRINYPLVNFHNYGTSPFSMGKLTIKMAMFNSYASHHQRVNHLKSHQTTIFLWFSYDFPSMGKSLVMWTPSPDASPLSCPWTCRLVSSPSPESVVGHRRKCRTSCGGVGDDGRRIY